MNKITRAIAVATAATVGVLGLAAPAEAALPTKVAVSCTKVTTTGAALPLCVYVKYKQRASGSRKTIAWKVAWDQNLRAGRSNDNRLYTCGKKYTRASMSNGVWYAVNNSAFCSYQDASRGVIDGPWWHNDDWAVTLR